MKHLVVGIGGNIDLETADRIKAAVEAEIDIDTVIISGCTGLVVIDDGQPAEPARLG